MSFNNTRTPTKSNTKPKYPVPMRPNGKNGTMAYYMEGELKQKFCRLFTIHSNRRIMQWFGISFSTVQRFKREFGLEKNMKVIRKVQARDIKKPVSATAIMTLCVARGRLRPAWRPQGKRELRASALSRGSGRLIRASMRRLCACGLRDVRSLYVRRG